jgi:hypothetical protein
MLSLPTARLPPAPLLITNIVIPLSMIHPIPLYLTPVFSLLSCPLSSQIHFLINLLLCLIPWNRRHGCGCAGWNVKIM